MSRKIYGKDLFQFGLIIFIVLGLSIGIVLTNGRGALNSLLDAQVQIGYCVAQNQRCAPGGTECCKGSTCKFSEGEEYKCTQIKCMGLRERCSPSLKDCCGGYACTWLNNSYSCQAPTGVTYTKCQDTNVFTCTGTKCSIKSVCQNGCTKSEYQEKGILGGAEAKCIYSYNRFTKCSADKKKIIQCDGIMCTENLGIIEDCWGSGNRELCYGTYPDIRCQDPPG